MSRWQNRVVDHDDAVDPEQLLANPLNWRIHPRPQQKAMEAILDEVGWLGSVIVNRLSGCVVDGHMRVSIAISAGETVPVDYVELSEEEEAKALATYDTITMLAVTDPASFQMVIDGISDLDESIQAAIESAHRPASKPDDERRDDAKEPTSEQAADEPEREAFVFGYIHWTNTHIDCQGETIEALTRWYLGYKAEHGGRDTGFGEWLVETLSEVLD